MRILFRLIVLLGVILTLFLVIIRNIRAQAVSPPSSSNLALTSEGRTLLVANPDSNTLSIIDTLSQERLAEIPVGVEPRGLTLSASESLAFVVNRGSSSLSVVNIATGTVQATLPLGNEPATIVLSPDRRTLAIAETGDDQVRFLDAIDFSTLGIVSVGDRPFGLAFAPGGRKLLISHLLSGEVTVLAAPPYDLFLPWIGRSASAEWLFIKSLLPLETPFLSSDLSITTWPNVAPAPAVVVNSSGTRAYLPQTMANGLGLNVQFDSTVFPRVSVLNLKTNTHQTTELISLPETDQPVGLPWDVALAKADSELWVVNAASNDVSVIDISNPTLPVRAAHIPVGDNPRGLVLSPDGTRVYVHNTLAGTVSVLDAATYTVTGVITSTQIPLPPLLINGKRLFHSSARPELSQASWIACNTCHIEGAHDGRTWQLQFLGPVPIGATAVITRNTTSLLGMLQTYPLRWSAEWNESSDSEFAVRFEQFGAGLIPGEIHPTLGDPNQGRAYDLDSLGAFIDSLQVRVRSHALSPQEADGKQIFFSAQTGCAICHPPPYYTDFQAHDVGTANAPWEWFGPQIDTPTLRMLYDSGPYLHHGSAMTLLDVLTTSNPDDQHGVTSQLSPQELADLVAFLLVLPYE